MDYELAKKLKDAGFPQSYGEYMPGSFFGLDDVAKPSLENLLEEVGSPIVLCSLTQGEWGAHIEKGSLTLMGSSPEVAVANLWLELNKKNG